MSDNITGFEIEVPAPPLVRRDQGLLIDALLPITFTDDRPTDPGSRDFAVAGREEAGVLFCSVGCAGLATWADSACVETAPDLPDPADGDGAAFGSFLVSADETSPARFDEAWIRSRLASRMDTMISSQLAAELQTGAQTGNPSLQTSATHVVAAVTPIDEAMYVLEDILAGFDDLAFYIHMGPGVLALLFRDYDLRDYEGKLLTPTGHTVISDAGYNGGLGPVDPDDPEGGAISTDSAGAWIYATMPVAGWVGPERTIGTADGRFDRERNTRLDAIIRPAVVAFDPCVVVAVQVAVPTYELDVAGS